MVLLCSRETQERALLSKRSVGDLRHQLMSVVGAKLHHVWRSVRWWSTELDPVQAGHVEQRRARNAVDGRSDAGVDEVVAGDRSGTRTG